MLRYYLLFFLDCLQSTVIILSLHPCSNDIITRFQFSVYVKWTITDLFHSDYFFYHDHFLGCSNLFSAISYTSLLFSVLCFVPVSLPQHCLLCAVHVRVCLFSSFWRPVLWFLGVSFLLINLSFPYFLHFQHSGILSFHSHLSLFVCYLLFSFFKRLRKD